ncbi:MAG: hypothetical protein ABI193_01285, partial [Minicystis sp.]
MASGSAGPMASGSAPPPTDASPASSSGRRGRGARGNGGEQPLDLRFVWVMRGLKPERVPVRIGLTDGTLTEVVGGGLKEGDMVVTEAISSDDSAAPATTTKAPGGGQSGPRLRL